MVRIRKLTAPQSCEGSKKNTNIARVAQHPRPPNDREKLSPLISVSRGNLLTAKLRKSIVAIRSHVIGSYAPECESYPSDVLWRPARPAWDVKSLRHIGAVNTWRCRRSARHASSEAVPATRIGIAAYQIAQHFCVEQTRPILRGRRCGPCAP